MVPLRFERRDTASIWRKISPPRLDFALTPGAVVEHLLAVASSSIVAKEVRLMITPARHVPGREASAAGRSSPAAVLVTAGLFLVLSVPVSATESTHPAPASAGPPPLAYADANQQKGLGMGFGQLPGPPKGGVEKAEKRRERERKRRPRSRKGSSSGKR
jgi:hypothetical protein